MNELDLQNMLDVAKWLQSEKNRQDLCGKYDYCDYCENEREYPCANAYVRQQKALEKVGEDTKAAADVKPDKKAKTQTTAAEKNSEKPRIETVPFAVKLENAQDDLKHNFNAVKNFYKSRGVSARITNKSANFRIGGKLVGVVTICRRTMRLQLPLEPVSEKYSKIPHNDYSDKKRYAVVPFSMKISSALSLKRAEKLIDETLSEAKK